MLRSARRSQARRAGDFDAADPKWRYEIFDATSFFRFAGAPPSDITARKKGSSLRTEERVLAVERLIRICNFWALTAPYMVGKSWKIADFNFGRSCHAGGRGLEPCRFRQGNYLRFNLPGRRSDTRWEGEWRDNSPTAQRYNAVDLVEPINRSIWRGRSF
jgi:hypothetical protein